MNAVTNDPGLLLQIFRFQCELVREKFAASSPDAVVLVCASYCTACLSTMQEALKGNIFSEGVGGYSGEELTAASIAVFGEMSSRQAKTDKEKETQTTEAQAIASELFNRQNRIKGSGVTDLAAYDRAIRERKEAAKKLHDTQVWKDEQRAISEMEDKIAPFSRYLSDNKNKPVTLTNLASANQQFLGYDKAKKDMKAMADKGAIKGEECARQCQRWEAATKAVRGFANDPKSLDAFNKAHGWFDSNRSNDGGKRPMNPGDVRIGGNDFFKQKF